MVDLFFIHLGSARHQYFPSRLLLLQERSNTNLQFGKLHLELGDLINLPWNNGAILLPNAKVSAVFLQKNLEKHYFILLLLLYPGILIQCYRY